MGKCKIPSWKLPLKCKQLNLRSSSGLPNNWKQPSSQASAASNSWKTPLPLVCLPASPGDSDCAVHLWKNPSTAGPIASNPVSSRTVSVTSASLQLASQADPSTHEIPMSKAAQNGTDPNRLHRVLKGKCGCKKDCYKKFNFSQLKSLCVVFWKLSKNEQEHLDAHSDSYDRNQHASRFDLEPDVSMISLAKLRCILCTKSSTTNLNFPKFAPKPLVLNCRTGKLGILKAFCVSCLI